MKHDIYLRKRKIDAKVRRGDERYDFVSSFYSRSRTLGSYVPEKSLLVVDLTELTHIVGLGATISPKIMKIIQRLNNFGFYEYNINCKY